MSCCRFIALAVFLLCARAVFAQNSLDPSVAVSRSGRVAVIHAMSAPDPRVVLTISDSLGAHRIDTVIVNQGMAGSALDVSIAPGANDDFLVAWDQYSGAASQVWCARYSAGGEKLGAAVCAADSIGVSARMPRIATGLDGRSVVAWQDYRRRLPDLMYQLFDPSLKKIGSNQLLASYPGIPFAPVPAVSPANEIAFVYQQTIGDTFHVCARVAPWNRPLGRVVILDRGAQNRAYSTNPDCAWLGVRELAAVWKDYRAGNSDIYLQRFTSKGRLVGENRRVNDDTTEQWQRLPRIAVAGSLVTVVWEDYRSDPRNQMGDVYAQWFRVKGMMPLKHNMRVNTSDEPTSQTAPSVAWDRKGRVVVVWCDAPTDKVSISGRYLLPGEHGDATKTTGGLRRPFK